MKEKGEKGVRDVELVKLAQAGDLDAFDELFALHRRGLLAYVSGRIGNRGLAEEVVQDCFVKLAEKLGDLDRGRGAGPWLYRVARNRAIDVMRKRRFEVQVEPGDLDGFMRSAGREGVQDPGDELLQKERRERMRMALRALPEKERELLTLRYYGGLTFREISEVVKRPLGTVLWQVRSAVEQLGRKFGE